MFAPSTVSLAVLEHQMKKCFETNALVNIFIYIYIYTYLYILYLYIIYIYIYDYIHDVSIAEQYCIIQGHVL